MIALVSVSSINMSAFMENIYIYIYIYKWAPVA